MYKKPLGSVTIPSFEQVENERKRLRRIKDYRKALRGTVYSLIIVAAAAVLIATLFLPVLQVSGTSMEPTLKDGDIIILAHMNDFNIGDVCGFYYQNKLLLKRVIGLPGNYIEIDSEGTVYVDGEALDEPYIMDKSLGECDIEFPYQVPDDGIFVMGDHRKSSIDSRSTVVGSIKKDQIVGRVLFRIWPLNSKKPKE